MQKTHDEQTLKILNKNRISHGAKVNHTGAVRQKENSAVLLLSGCKILRFCSLWIFCIPFDLSSFKFFDTLFITDFLCMTSEFLKWGIKMLFLLMTEDLCPQDEHLHGHHSLHLNLGSCGDYHILWETFDSTPATFGLWSVLGFPSVPLILAERAWLIRWPVVLWAFTAFPHMYLSLPG